MFKNYFKIAIRNLRRNIGFSTINIVGLSIGMASAILILLWIQNEVSYDNWHEKRDRIYEVWNKAEFSGKLHSWNTTPKVLARAAEKDLPEIEAAVRVDWQRSTLFSIGDKRIVNKGNPVDSNFLQVFSFPMLKGNPATALSTPNSIVLTESLSKKLYGDEDAMGQIIKIEDKDNYTVTGIVKDPPINSRFNFEFLLPWGYIRANENDDQNWGNNNTRTYVLLKKNASLKSAQEKMKLIKRRYQPEEDKWEMFLYPMSRWRLYSSFENGVEDGGGRIEFVRMFGIIAAFILLIACINFMNLSTARSEKRSKEVGIRKVVGAQKTTLISQFIGESILLAFLAGIVALVIVAFSLPAFNQLTEKKLAIDFSNVYFWLAAIGFILFTGLLAGSYPAFFLSSFKPVTVLKGTFKKANQAFNPRKFLVVLQFTFAIILIICTIIVKQQIDFARSREMGYSQNDLVYHIFTGDINKNFELIRNELISNGIAESVTKTSAPITESWSDGWGQEWEGKDPNDKTDFYRFNQDYGLGKTAGLQFIKGRDFDLKEYPTDSFGLIINESALEIMKFKEPIGQIVRDMGEEWHITGVIKDFILTNPYEPTRPMLIFGAKAWFNVMLIKLNPNNSTQSNIARAESIFKRYNKEFPFEIKFVDSEYESKFEDEKRTGKLAALFAGLTVLISCLGLFGLATYMAENRIKEIGVRKVLGATVTNITTLLNRDFLKLVIVSFAIAAPIAWYMMHQWLQDYTYHTAINWWVFLVAGVLTLLIAFVTVSYQSIKAAITNPVKSLRSE